MIGHESLARNIMSGTQGSREGAGCILLVRAVLDNAYAADLCHACPVRDGSPRGTGVVPTDVAQLSADQKMLLRCICG